MGIEFAKGYADMMVCMAKVGKLTYEDMDYIMGFDSSETRDATYAELERIKPSWFDESMERAEETQRLIDGKREMDILKERITERQGFEGI